MSSPTARTRTTVVHIFQGDDIDPLEALRREVDSSALVAGPKRIGDSPAVKTAVQQYDEFLAEATERAVQVHLAAVGRKVWRSLVDKHPPRSESKTITGPDGTQTTETEVNEQDALWGFNYETFADDLVPACVAPGQFGSDVDRDAFLDSLSDGDWSRLYAACVQLNQGAGPDPFARLSSRLAQSSSETSESPARLG